MERSGNQYEGRGEKL